MKKIFVTLVVLAGSLSGNLFCQVSDEIRNDFEEGQYFFNRGDFEDALFYYLKLVSADSMNANFNFKVGECYLNISGKEHWAIPYFEKAQTTIVQKKAYKKRSVDERAAPLHVYFYLGNAYRIDNQLDKALASYQKFIDSPFFYGNYNLNIVENEIKTCERAKIIQDDPVQFSTVNAGPAVNSELSEEMPVVSGDGNTLVFIRKMKFYDAVFYSVKVDGQWQQSINMNPQIISDGEYYPSGLDFEGHRLLLIRKEGENYDIYISRFDGEKWSTAEKMNDKINSLTEEISASFCPDNSSMIFSRNGHSKKGGCDLFITSESANGTWQKPKKLGKVINTAFDEQCAFLTINPEILFFSSKGHYTMGGYDIFYSRKNGKKWDTPINIGYPINNTNDNLYYCPVAGSYREGYYARLTDDGFGASDIYMIQIQSEKVLNITSDKP